jgi:CPA2 family monovalent cation:H+ antiporter-2
MIVAAVVAVLFHRLRQPVVLGYILAGFIVGPHFLDFSLVTHKESIETLAELGMVFLMFSLGLHFSLRQLRQVGTTALLAAVLEILLMVWIGYEVGVMFGWSKMDSIFLGAMLSISSTTIIVKALQDMGRSREKFSQIIFGILIVEDILAISMIALLSGIALTGTLEPTQVLSTVGRISVFLVVALVAGLLLVPPLLRYVARFRSEELMLVSVLGLCLGLALFAEKLGYSVALGAFVIGTVIGEAREIGLVKRLTEPVRDMFSAVFFVAMGMLIDPRLLAQYAVPILVITLAVLIGKVATCAFGTFVAGHDTRTSLRVGMGLAQIGEFSFIMASLGLTLKVTSDFLYPVAISVSAITTLLTPLLIRSSDGLVARFDRLAPAWLVHALSVYSEWVEQLRSGRRDTPGRKMAKKWSLQIVLNLALVTGVYLAAVALTPFVQHWWPGIPDFVGGASGLLWLAAAILTLPGLIAAIRKLEALAMLISEMSVGMSPEQPAIRAIIYHTIYVSGLLGFGLWVLTLSSTILPTGPSLIVLLLTVSLVTILLWRFFIQIHAKAQLILREAWSHPSPAAVQPATEHLTTLLHDASLATVSIEPGGHAVGKLIRELELRTITGASIVGIERVNGHSVINPGPDEELQSGDQVLLIGSREQLEAARVFLLRSAVDTPRAG